MRPLYVILLACSLATFSNAVTAQQTATDSRKGKKTTTLNRTVLLSLVNAARTRGVKCGETFYPAVAPLTWDPLLEKAAFAHSSDMYNKRYFSHVSGDGSRAGDRIAAAGYNWTLYGENIGQGYANEREVVEGWLSSPGHCKNIMNGGFKEMGIGRAGLYWTQDFGSR